MPLKIKVKRTEAGVLTFAPVGSVDARTVSSFDEQLQKIAGEPIKTLVLDMADVEFITSGGISAIAKAKASLTDKGGEFAMVHLQPQVKRVFEIMRLLPAMNVFGGREELDEYLTKVQHRIVDDQ